MSVATTGQRWCITTPWERSQEGSHSASSAPGEQRITFCPEGLLSPAWSLKGHPAHLYSALLLESSNTQRSWHECFTKGALVWVDLGNLISLKHKCTHIFVTEFVQSIRNCLFFFIHALYWFEKIGISVVLQQRNVLKTVGKLETDLLLLHWKYSRCVSKALTPAA